MAHSFFLSRLHPFLLALLLAGGTMPAAAAGPAQSGSSSADAGPRSGTSSGTSPEASGSSQPDSPPDWSGAREGDFVEYSLMGSDGSISQGSASFTVRLQVHSVDDKEVRVAVEVSPDPPALFARGLLFVMQRAAPSSEEPDSDPQTFFGQELKEGRERVFIGDSAIVCQKLGGEVTSSHGPMFSGCVAPSDRLLYLGGGVVRYSMSQMSIQGDGSSYKLTLEALGREPPPRELPPRAFREGNGYERFSRDRFDTRIEQHTLRTRNGLVEDETVLWNKEEGAKRQRSDRVFQGTRLTRVDYTWEKPLLEYVYDLLMLSLHEPYPDKGRPATPKLMSVAGRRVPTWKHHETWKEQDEEGESEAIYAWDPWALEGAPVEVRFLPFTSKLSTWPPGKRKEAETEESRTLRWY